MHHLYKTLVFEYKVVDYQYFMDVMSFYEINDIIDYVKFSDRGAWDRARLQSYIVGATQTKSIKKPTDIVKFPWDEEYKEEKRLKTKKKTGFAPTTDEDIKRMMNLAKRWEK